MASNKIVVIEGEEDIMVIHLASFWYIKGGVEVQKIPFPSFEVVNVDMVGPIGEDKIVEFWMASLKDDHTIIKNGHPEGWGRILEIPINNDHTGLGYNSQNLKKQTPIGAKRKILPLSEFFSSVGHLVNGQIFALEEDGLVKE